MSSWPLLHASQNSSLNCNKASLRQGISQLALLLDSFHLLVRRAICLLHPVPKSPSSQASNPALEGHHLAFLMISALDVVRALSRVHQSNSLPSSHSPTPTRSRKRSRSSESGSSSAVMVGVCYAARVAAELLCQCVELLGRRVRIERVPPSTSAVALTAAFTSTSNASPSLQPQNARGATATRSRSRPGGSGNGNSSRSAAVRRPLYSLAHRRECLLAALECAQLLVDHFSAALRPPAFTHLLQQASKRSSKRKRATCEQISENGPAEESAAGVAVGERESECEYEPAQTVLLQAVLAAEALAVALTRLVHAHKSILLVHMDHVLVHLLRGPIFRLFTTCHFVLSMFCFCLIIFISYMY